MTRVDLTTWTGTAIALLGLVVASPEAFAQLGRSASARRRRALRWIRVNVLRRPGNTVIGLGSVGSLGLIGRARARIGYDYAEGADLAGQVAQLRVNVKRLVETFQEHSEAELDRHEEQVKAVNDLREEMLAEMASVREEITKAERRAVSVNANAIPVIVLGLLLSGLSDLIARLAWPTVSAGNACALAVAVGLLVRVLRERPVRVP